ncbi:hypothetical protein [Marinomonas mediterranea]|jgi:hypothetical protein|uniref:Uncharacterized protein n=1 Tax=Marinomonas mediterranea (strain ATCC 700492 / JCM 21426 / NBRC 103028 / MMB-1) TaxID=717774 RepID=F2K1R2_MARM1|nr:hypothetical protein [Marinomonas mediterranea]ADZ93396.1 hypothetical protein Marme_4197 [Marinomonas mediterranea MMB-1]WCN11284.1 hypothetical protein GV055_21290 [Marinomonas mediterranea]WCN15349.1 hypothetical protein GV054_21220 [Marinomonas mediterranea]WCN19390.1 hypothetical protein GV053_21250 [Marinomonas mediterranea MMB-1]
MSVNNEIARLTQAVQDHTNETQSFLDKADGRVRTAESKFESWKANSGFVPQRDNLMAMPLNYNAFLQDLGDGPLDGWGARGTVTIEAVHPFTKGFEGPYLPEKPDSAASSIEEATKETPFYYGRYNKGARAGRGGLAGGWGGISGGHILRIYKPAGEEHRYANSCMFSMIETYKRNRSRFRAYVYVSKGPLNFDFGHTDDGGQINIPSAKEWHFIDQVVGQSEICSSYMNINIDHAEECELYLAMINVLPIEGEGNQATLINRRSK